MAHSDSVGKGKVKAVDGSMLTWFQQATPEERDALSALQLDYQFTGDNLGSIWWLVLQELGFTHNKTAYELPESAPASIKDKAYTGNEVYEFLDRFAIPQISSPFQVIPLELSSCRRIEEQKTEDGWWQDIRDELIFRKFYQEVQGFRIRQLQSGHQAAHTPKPKSQFSDAINSGKRRRNIQASKDAGAELFMRQIKKRKPSDLKETRAVGSIEFPTIAEYAVTIAHSFNPKQAEDREEVLVGFFDEWKFITLVNHSVLLYGIGSKRTLLNRFAAELEIDADLILIDGFHKDIAIEGILDLIVATWLGGETPFYNRFDVHTKKEYPHNSCGSHYYPQVGDSFVIQKAISISKALGRRTIASKRAHYLIINSIDGVGLRNSTAQEAFAALASHSMTPRGLNALRLIASVDHVNTPAVLWDSLTCERFHWVWKQADTHRPYVDELTQSLISDKTFTKTSQRKKESGNSPEHKAIFSVLSSLAPRHTESLKQLAGMQANRLSRGEEWVPYKSLLTQCRHKCVVSDDNQLRAFLKELEDHGIVEQGSTADAGALSFRVPYGVLTLKQILDFTRSTS